MGDTGKTIALIKALGGGGGTSNYNSLSNKPSINGVTLSGNKTAADLGLDAVVPVFTPDQSQTPSDDPTQPSPLLCDKTFDEVYLACEVGRCPYAVFSAMPNAQLIVKPVSIGSGSNISVLIFEGLMEEEVSQIYIRYMKTPLGEGAVAYSRPVPNVADVQVNGTSITDSNGVANVPVASGSTFGVVKAYTGDTIYGVSVDTSGVVKLVPANDTNVKDGTVSTKAVVPARQHAAVYYGLSKLAGVDLKNETVTVGTYPASSKAAIQSMLGVEPGVSFVETVSGTTPTITGEANVRYICGEVSTLSITPPSAGTIVVRFTSGSTATVLTLPQTVIFPAGVDLTTLDASTVYEIMITDGVYGGVMTWAVSA